MSFLNILLFLLFNFVVVSISEHAQKFIGSIIIDQPLDGVLEKWYPKDFENNHASLISTHQKCTVKIEFRKGWTARVILTVNSTSKHPSVKILDQFGIVDHVFTTSNEHFYFNEKGGLIELNTGHHKTHFGFKVDWVENKKIPIPSAMEYIKAFFQNRPVEYAHDYEVNEIQRYPELMKVLSSTHVVIKAESRVSMNVIASSKNMDKQLLRSVFVYDGPNLESPCLGTAYQLWKMKSQYVSTGKYMTIQFASRDIESSNRMILAQDYATTNHITHFQGVTCKTGENCGVYELDARNGPVALQSIYDTNIEEKDVVTGLEGDGFLTVHIGGAKKNMHNKLLSYDGIDDGKYLPQYYIAPVKSYVLHNGTMKIRITRNSEEFKKTRKFGRIGTILSNWFGCIDNKRQFAFEEVFAPESFSNAKFSYRIDYLGWNEGASFRIVGTRNGEQTYQKILNYTISHFEQDKGRGYPRMLEDEFNGDRLAVYFNATGYESGGVKVDFHIVEP